MAYSRIRFEIQNSATMTLVQRSAGEFPQTVRGQSRDNADCFALSDRALDCLGNSEHPGQNDTAPFCQSGIDQRLGKRGKQQQDDGSESDTTLRQSVSKAALAGFVCTSDSESAGDACQALVYGGNGPFLD